MEDLPPMEMRGKKKECLHTFRSVYYGSEWEVECEKCDRNIYDVYEKPDANKIIKKLLAPKKSKMTRVKQIGNSFYPQYKTFFWWNCYYESELFLAGCATDMIEEQVSFSTKEQAQKYLKNEQ